LLAVDLLAGQGALKYAPRLLSQAVVRSLAEPRVRALEATTPADLGRVDDPSVNHTESALDCTSPTRLALLVERSASVVVRACHAAILHLLDDGSWLLSSYWPYRVNSTTGPPAAGWVWTTAKTGWVVGAATSLGAASCQRKATFAKF
jgi:hypothetical protein